MIRGPESSRDLEAIHVRHLDVDECDIEHACDQEIERILRVSRRQDRMSQPSQRLGRELEIDRVIVDNEKSQWLSPSARRSRVNAMRRSRSPSATPIASMISRSLTGRVTVTVAYRADEIGEMI